MFVTLWSIEIATNPGIVNSDLGFHIDFFNGDEEFGDLGPYFTSPHVNKLNEQEAERAKARLKTLLRLISGINLILGNRSLMPKSETLYYLDNRERYKKFHPEISMQILFEELENPFDMELLSENPSLSTEYSHNIRKDYFQLTSEDELVREVLLLLTLGEEQILYFLINTYKIVENIKSELSLSKNNGKLNVTDDSPTHLPESLLKRLNNANEFAQYINSRDASGILSRHGQTKIMAPKAIPTIEEIREVLFKTVNEWLNYKCSIRFNRKYKIL